MAATDIHSICTTLRKAIDYIQNPNKTDDGRLISFLGCAGNGKDVERAFMNIRNQGTGRGKILAQSVRQSFVPGEITPEQAHRIGLQLAERLLNNQYQYVLTTHVDKAHIHNHLIFNNIDFMNFRSFEYQENRGGKVFEKVQQISDDLCREYGLHVIAQPEHGKGKSWYEWSMNRDGLSWKTKLKHEIDQAIMDSVDFNDFLRQLEKRNVECVYRPENVISLKFRMEGQQKFCRARTLGWYYEEPQIRRRIEQYQILKTGHASVQKKPNFIDTQTDRMQSSPALQRWADIQNMKEASRILNYLTEMNIRSPEELEQRSIERYGERVQFVGELNRIQTRIDKLSDLIKLVKSYLKYRPVYQAYQKTPLPFKRKFEKENAPALETYRSVKEQLMHHFPDRKLPTPDTLTAERAELTEKRTQLNAEYKRIIADLEKMDEARTSIAAYLHEQQDRKQSKEKKEGIY